MLAKQYTIFEPSGHMPGQAATRIMSQPEAPTILLLLARYATNGKAEKGQLTMWLLLVVLLLLLFFGAGAYVLTSNLVLMIIVVLVVMAAAGYVGRGRWR